MTASAAEVEAAQKAMREHRPTRGMKVAMGETCECGYWTGSEPQGPIPAGASLLFNHVAQAVADAVVAAAQPRGYERWEYGVERGPFGDKFPAHIEWGSSDGMSHHYEYTAENVHALASGRPVFRRLRTSFPDVLGEPEPFPSADDIEA